MSPSDEANSRSTASDSGSSGPESTLGATDQGIWSLAWPTMAAMGAGTVVRFTDFAMVGDLGPSALAAVGLGGQFYWLLESLAAIAPAGLAAILARAVGAGDRGLADASFRQAQVLGGLLGLAGCLVLFPLTTEAIEIYGVESDVVELGASYLWWRLWGTVPLSIAMVFGAALRAAGDVRTPLWAGLLAAAVNVLYGNLGAPVLGVTGAAIASDIALVVMALFFFWLWIGKALVLKPGRGRWALDLDLQRRLVRVGTPAGIESGFFQIGLLVFQRIMAPFGTNVIAAYNVGSMLLSFSFIPGVAFSMAAATLVGQHLGAKTPERAEREGWRSMVSTIVTMTLFGALLMLGARPIAAVFTTDPAVIDLTVTIIWILGIAHPFMAVEFALGGALRGAGDTLFPMITVFSGLLVVRLGLATGLVVFLDAPIEWVWAVLLVDYLLKSVMLVARFRNGAWKHREV
jgi:putative MATE family efflux protein